MHNNKRRQKEIRIYRRKEGGVMEIRTHRREEGVLEGNKDVQNERRMY